jgi:Zn-dependent peptidase ImmA (M78 family)/transcriptional regulator with XRE-family HTH domain
MFLAPAEAARKIGVRESVLEDWEAGNARPTLPQLRKAASVYRKPLATFLLAAPPSESRAIVEFRMLPETEVARPSPAFADGLRRALEQQVVARHLADLSGDDVPRMHPSLKVSEDTEQSGQIVRDWLDVTLPQHLRWKSNEDAFRGWSRAVENRDILVIHISRVELSEMRAFAEQSQPFPVIGLNGKDSATGKTFSLMHELVHILMASGRTPALHVFRADSSWMNRNTSSEVFCNQVAAATLMPARDLLVQIGSADEPGIWTDEQLRQLSARYNVSREALLLRLVSLGRADQAFYQMKRKQFEAEYRQRAEAQQSDSGGGDYYRLKVRDLGHRYIADVLAAYDNDDISSRDVTQFLGVQLGQLPRLENLVQRR